MRLWTKAAVQGAACGVMFGLVVVLGGRLWQPHVAAAQVKQPAVAEVVKARRFEVVDTAGKVWAVLAVRAEGAGLVFADAAGNVRVNLFVGSNRDAGLVVGDAAGKPRASLGLAPDGTSGLGLSDATGKVRATVGVLLGGTPALGLSDAAGKVIWKAP